MPEIASRAHVRQVLPMIDEALNRAGVTLRDLDAIAVATRPGLVGALVVGLTAAKTLAMALDIPLIAVDHLEGHLYACQLAHPDRDVYPCIGLVVSGGHTSLYHCSSPLESTLLGGTTDDAAGEAFDKVASLMGLGYPGGPAIERVAQGRERERRSPCLDRSSTTIGRSSASPASRRPCSTRSTARMPDRAEILLDDARMGDLAASFQEAVVNVLVAKTRQALLRSGLKRLGVGGGVAANRRFRERIGAMADELGVELFIPPPALCTDNAAMAAIALPKLWAGEVARTRRRCHGRTRPPRADYLIRRKIARESLVRVARAPRAELHRRQVGRGIGRTADIQPPGTRDC